MSMGNPDNGPLSAEQLTMQAAIASSHKAADHDCQENREEKNSPQARS
jgi:hypothetical protein